MVEVHLDGFVAHLHDAAHEVVALSVAHGYLVAHEEHIVGGLAVDDEYIFRQVDDGLGYDLAVTVLGLEREGYLLAGFETHDGTLEFGQEHARSAYELQGRALARLISYLAVDGEGVVHRHHFAVFYFHTLCFNMLFVLRCVVCGRRRFVV